MNREVKEQILQKIKAYDRIFLFRHVRPDGDCMGATKGFADILRKSFPEKEVYIIGGESIYRQMLPYCDVAHVTRIDRSYEADTYFPDLDQDPQWELAEVLQSGEENGIGYEMCLYKRI